MSSPSPTPIAAAESRVPADGIVGATRSYEGWLSGFMKLSTGGIEKKHADMMKSPFIFLRATYYRWAQLFPLVCPEIAAAPKLLAVGDLHVDNFGTWRDAEGRLVWGINDFDEAAKLPYTNDLVRLALSAKLSLDLIQDPPIDFSAACEAVVEGYGDALADGTEDLNLVNPIVLVESYGWLAKIAAEHAVDPERFWQKLDAQTSAATPPHAKIACKVLRNVIPSDSRELRWTERVAGEGSLGRPRFVGIGDWFGAKIAREAKAMAPSAALWAKATTTRSIRYRKIVESARRSRDPFLMIAEGRSSNWVIRRLAPDCHRIEIDAVQGSIDEKLFHAMGHETANVHLGQPARCRAALAHLHSLGPHCDWLHEAVGAMERALLSDYEDWKSQKAGGEMHSSNGASSV